MIRLLLAAFACALLWVHGVPPAAADDTRPAMLLIEEEAPGTYALRWQTPLRQGATLRLSPRLPPEAQRVDGTYTRALLGDALVETWRITLPGGLA
ncbi:MAG: hypothetical protein P1V36_12385, partial [Planctomycetota bacterium]|nr:hypothetical protein [Planctomycetota bacterium]